MDINVQDFPIIDSKDIVIVDESITNARRAYNLLQKNGLMSESSESICITSGKIEVLCNEKLCGIIPSLFKSALHYPCTSERAVYNLVLCQYIKSKIMSVCDNAQEVNNIQSKLDELKEAFYAAYKYYLQVKDHPTQVKERSFTPSIGVIKIGDNFAPCFSPGINIHSTTYNNDVSVALKEMEAINIKAKEIYNELKTKIDFNKSILTNEAVKDFADKASKIAKPVAVNIEEENSRKLFSKWIRYNFSFKGEWASEETILSISRFS